jgi:hypothetical protein
VISPEDLDRFTSIALAELAGLHDGNIARFRLAAIRIQAMEGRMRSSTLLHQVYRIGYNWSLIKSTTKPATRPIAKPLTFIGSSLDDLRDFPRSARREGRVSAR